VWLPNMRMQRTRRLASLGRSLRSLGSPLTRKPLGAGRSIPVKAAFLALAILAMSDSPVVWTAPGEIRVVVVDRDAAALPGVAVTLLAGSRQEPERVTITDSKGHASFSDVPVGEYTLRFQISGAAECSIGPFTMRAGPHDNPWLPEFRVVMNPIRWVG
jgi:hypothetical protein